MESNYGRLRRYVYFQGGTFVNAEPVRLGYAQIATFPPDVRHQALFLELQQGSRAAGLDAKTAGGDGRLSWTWRVGSNTTPRRHDAGHVDGLRGVQPWRPGGMAVRGAVVGMGFAAVFAALTVYVTALLRYTVCGSRAIRGERLVKTVIIIGGGVGGLCTAIALQKIGIEATVYERAGTFGDVGSGLSLWANAISALRRLGPADGVIAAGAKIHHGQIRTRTGKILAQTGPGELEKMFGEPSIVIHRTALHQVLLDALPPETVRTGATCTGLEQDREGVTAYFAGGRQARADVIVGADGVRSAIRRQLFPAIELRYAGYTAWRGVVQTGDEIALGITSESWGCGNRFGILRLDAERVYWFATANSAPGKTYGAEERKSLLQGIFQEWHHPVAHLIEQTPAASILHNDIYDVQPMARWSKGRVTLLGDAAHPTTPNMGQGACMAIESADVLAQCLSQNDDVETALAEYERRRRPRTARITNQSWQIGRVGQLENGLACTLRNALFRLMPAGILKGQMARIVGNMATK